MAGAHPGQRGLHDPFIHDIDVVPTMLDVIGIRAPEHVDGIKQKPVEGPGFAYAFDAKNAKAPSRHKTQYFEMTGQRALYHDGWERSTKFNRSPWQAFGEVNPDPLNNQVFPLNASVAARVAAPRPSLGAGRSELTCTRPMTGTPQGVRPTSSTPPAA